MSQSSRNRSGIGIVDGVFDDDFIELKITEVSKHTRILSNSKCTTRSKHSLQSDRFTNIKGASPFLGRERAGLAHAVRSRTKSSPRAMKRENDHA
jgi:hypothetical protein